MGSTSVLLGTLGFLWTWSTVLVGWGGRWLGQHWHASLVSPLMLSKEKETKRAGVSGRWGQVTRMPRNKGREKEVRWLWFEKVFDFWPEVFVLKYSKILNITYRWNHVHWIEDQVLGLGVVVPPHFEIFCFEKFLNFKNCCFYFWMFSSKIWEWEANVFG